MRSIYILVFIFFSVVLSGQEEKVSFEKALKIHLDAVSNKDLPTLTKTLSPDGKMLLILPKEEMRTTAKEFLDYHEAWFQDTTWSFATKIISSDVGSDLGIGIVEIVYSEPDRGGVPYFNRMHVSYGLKLIDGIWYVFKDHASSIEKRTD